MTTPLWCLLITALLPYVFAFTTGYFRSRAFGAVDNHNPRAQVALLEGTGARANAAQQNAWEALILFAVSLMAAHLAGVAPDDMATVSIVFVVARVAHGVCYLADLATPRSIVFAVGFICCMRLFWLAGTV